MASVCEMCRQLLAPAEEGEDKTTAAARLRLGLRGVLVTLWSIRRVLLALATLGGALSLRWAAPAWLAEQLGVLPAGIVLPMSAAQMADHNFWGGVMIAVLVLAGGTFVLVNLREVWEGFVIHHLFYYAWQKAAFKHLVMSTLQVEVGMFLARQVSMLSSKLFIMDPNEMEVPHGLQPILAHASDVEVYPRAIDMALRMCFYASTALFWTGIKAGLFAVPLKQRQWARRLGYCVHFFGVAMLRMYPSFAALNVDIVSAVRIVLFLYPITAIVFGAVAVVPGMLVGTWAKTSIQSDLARLLVIYGSHMTMVSWATHAGRALAIEIMSADQIATAFSLSPPLIQLGRMLIFVGLTVVVMTYVHAAHVLYLGSPFLMCTWEAPHSIHAIPSDDGDLASSIVLAIKDLLKASRSVAHAVPFGGVAGSAEGGGGQSDGASGGDRADESGAAAVDQVNTWFHGGLTLARDVLNLATGWHRLTMGGGTVNLHMTVRSRATNWAKRRFVMPPIRLEIMTQYATMLGLRSSSFVLAEVKVDKVEVPAAAPTAESWSGLVALNVHVSISVDALRKLLESQPLHSVDATLYTRSTLTQFQFAMPLVSYQRDSGWMGVLENGLIPDKARFAHKLQSKLHGLRSKIVVAQEELLRSELSRAGGGVRQSLKDLDTTIQQIANRPIDPELGPSHETLLDLLSAVSHILSIFLVDMESQDARQGRDQTDGPRVSAGLVALEQTAVVLMNQFYQLLSWNIGMRGNPAHVIVLSCLMLVAQGYLHPHHLGSVVERLGNAAPTDEDAASSSTQGSLRRRAVGEARSRVEQGATGGDAPVAEPSVPASASTGGDDDSGNPG